MKSLIYVCNIFVLFNHLTYAQNQLQTSLSESDLPAPGLECGTKHTNVDLIHDAPWSALIYYAGNRAGFYCGGSLISSDYILTVAHCIQGRALAMRRFSPKFVRLGEIDQGARKPCKTGECVDPVLDIPIAESIVHENYDPQSNSHYNDIALLRLARSVTFTDRIRPICLPFAQNIRNQNLDDQDLVAVGFGRTKDGRRSNVKTMQEVKGFSLDRCNGAYTQTGLHIISTQLCAADEHGDDACSAGGGGSLVGEHSINQTTYRYLAGIESFGSRICGAHNSPGIFTRVDQYLDWILNHMRQ